MLPLDQLKTYLVEFKFFLESEPQNDITISLYNNTSNIISLLEQYETTLVSDFNDFINHKYGS
jgi:hypothetical protein